MKYFFHFLSRNLLQCSAVLRGFFFSEQCGAIFLVHSGEEIECPGTIILAILYLFSLEMGSAVNRAKHCSKDLKKKKTFITINSFLYTNTMSNIHLHSYAFTQRQIDY